MSSPTVTRPGVVTFIAVVLYIQAGLALIAAIVLFAFSGRLAEALSDITTVEVTGGSVLLSAIVELIIAILLFVVAGGIMRGSPGFRLFVAIVEGVRMAAALFAMIYYHNGAFVETGLITIAIGIFVLWALYGNERADAFFRSSAQ